MERSCVCESKTKPFALTSEHIHQQNVHESELRFPGREDLLMEEDIEFKIQDIVRKIPLGTCKDGATFGEELAGTGFFPRCSCLNVVTNRILKILCQRGFVGYHILCRRICMY